MLLKRFLLVVLVTSFAASVTGQNEQQEAKLKAVFIYNFTKYIDWGSYNHGNDFTIGVAGNSAVTQYLNEIANSNTIDNKRIVITTIDKGSQLEDCDILFIPEECHFSLDYLLSNVRRGVLLISEQPGFAAHGTAFNFVTINNRLKFEANLKAISSAGLKAGAQLLKLAILVH